MNINYIFLRKSICESNVVMHTFNVSGTVTEKCGLKADRWKAGDSFSLESRRNLDAEKCKEPLMQSVAPFLKAGCNQAVAGEVRLSTSDLKVHSGTL